MLGSNFLNSGIGFDSGAPGFTTLRFHPSVAGAPSNPSRSCILSDGKRYERIKHRAKRRDDVQRRPQGPCSLFRIRFNRTPRLLSIQVPVADARQFHRLVKRTSEVTGLDRSSHVIEGFRTRFQHRLVLLFQLTRIRRFTVEITGRDRQRTVYEITQRRHQDVVVRGEIASHVKSESEVSGIIDAK